LSVTLVRETFVRTPLTVTIPNDGVAKVTTPTNPDEWDVLKYELEHFVCEGEYERGLQRVLSSFASNLGRSTQPAAWVSGFFGCGKSHFVRVLEYLWRDVSMPDGASTRSLVTLPPDIDELLRELTTAGKREGGLWSAAGTLSSGAAGFVRAAVLGVIFKRAGLPGRIPHAQFILYLHAEGLYDAVRDALKSADRDLGREVRNMHVSTPLAEAILRVKPDFASDTNEVKQQLRAQFRKDDDVNDEDMVDLLDQVLRLQSSDPEKLPCTLIVLDEVQQYVGGDPERCLHLQEAVEACSSRFGSSVLFVGTGQSALVGVTALSKLRDRFTVGVELNDTDVEKVIGKDFIFDQQESSMLQSGVLLPEVDANIRELRDGTEEGELRARMCALLFLVDQLPSDLRLKPTVETLADLLVTDLPAGSAALREKMPALLEGLVEQGKVMQVDEEYRLQTREGAEWEQAYRTAAARLRSDEAALAAARTTAFRTAVAEAVKGLTLRHGESKEPRKVEIHYAEDAPDAGLNAIAVWVRDEWSATEKAVRTDAQQAGVDSPTLLVHLPRVNADALREHLAGLTAANEVLETKGMPSSPEGQVARSSVETRRDTHTRRVETLVRDVLAEATVYQGGGNVVNAAQPVCRELLQFIGMAGKKGTEIRAHFGGGGYGWPRDAIDGALCVLTANGALRVARDGTAVPVGDLDHTRISQTDFRAETVMLSTTDRLAIRKLLQDAGHSAQPGEEAVEVPRLLDSLTELAGSAGGPAPLPAKPNGNHLTDLRAKKGNELLAAVLEARDRLQENREAGEALAQKARRRLPEWNDLQRLLGHAASLPVHGEVAPQAEAILTQRSLLDDPDPVASLLAKLEQTLRQAVTEAREQHLRAGTEKLGELTDSESWTQLAERQQGEINAQCGLQPLPELSFSTRAELLFSLERMPLSQWEDATAALAERVARALTMAAKLLEPKAERVIPPHAQLTTESEVDAYLGGLRDRIMEHLDAGKPVVL